MRLPYFVWTLNCKNIAISIALILILVLITCVARDAVSATVQPDGSWILSPEEHKVCEYGCKLISAYQVEVLTQYFYQVNAENEQLKTDIEQLKNKTCGEKSAIKVRR